MPIFDYKCKDCGKEFEKLVRKEEDKVCPDCARQRSWSRKCQPPLGSN